MLTQRGASLLPQLLSASCEDSFSLFLTVLFFRVPVRAEPQVPAAVTSSLMPAGSDSFPSRAHCPTTLPVRPGTISKINLALAFESQFCSRENPTKMDPMLHLPLQYLPGQPESGYKGMKTCELIEATPTHAGSRHLSETGGDGPPIFTWTGANLEDLVAFRVTFSFCGWSPHPAQVWVAKGFIKECMMPMYPPLLFAFQQINKVLRSQTWNKCICLSFLKHI